MADPPAKRALRSDLHLACVSGPDRGCVLPVAPGFIGRGLDLVSDPWTSRQAAYIFQDVRRERTRWGVVIGARTILLRPGSSLRIGKNRWVVRVRPGLTNWPSEQIRKPNRTDRLRSLRWLMPIVFLIFLLRIVPKPWLPTTLLSLLIVGGLSLLYFQSRFRRFDEAALLLALQGFSAAGAPELAGDSRASLTAQHFEAHNEKQELVLLERPGRPRKLRFDLVLGRPLTVLGAGSEPYALWLLGQSLLTGINAVQDFSFREPLGNLGPAESESGPDPGPVLSNHAPEPEEASSGAPSLRICTAGTVPEVPISTFRLVATKAVGSRSWVRQLRLSLAPKQLLPARLELSELVGRPSRQLVKEHWEFSRAVPVGVSQTGPVHLDLQEEGPHMLVVGGTGSGKSEFLTTFVLSLALRFSPRELRLVLVDFKGGTGIGHLSALPQVERHVTDLDGTSAAWLIRAATASLRHRKQLLSELNVRSLEEAQSSASTAGQRLDLPRLVIVVDEFQLLAERHPELLERLALLATQGRSYGLHLVLATQRPSGALSPALRAALDLRVALRCVEGRDSQEAIGSERAAQLPRIPGRAIASGKVIQTALTQELPLWAKCLQQAWINQSPGETLKLAIPRPLPTAWELESPLADDSAESPGFAAPGGKLRELPERIGMYESPRTGELLPLSPLTQSVCVAGPDESRAELEELAFGLSPQTAGIWIGSWFGEGVPPWLAAEAASRAGDLFLISGEDQPAAAALALTEVAEGRRSAPLLGVSGVSGFLSKLESVTSPSAVRTIWEKLQAQARSGNLQLIVTDSGGRFSPLGFPFQILKLPNRNALLAPRLAPFIPTHAPGTGGLPISRPADLEHFVSAEWGRVLLTHPGTLGEETTVWAQLKRNPGGGRQAPIAPVGITGHSQIPKWLLQETAPPLTRSTLILTHGNSEEALEDLLRRFASTSELITPKPMDSGPATTGVGSSDLLLLGLSASAARALSQRFPSDSVWLGVAATTSTAVKLRILGSRLLVISEEAVARLMEDLLQKVRGTTGEAGRRGESP